MLIGATKVYIILASIGILVSNLTTNEVCALFGCLLRFYGCVFFNLCAINSQAGCRSEPSLPAFRGCRIERLHPELNANNIINNNNVYFIL